MTQDPASPADACLHAALAAVAGARAAFGDGIAALLLALLARLFAVGEAAWCLSPEDDDDDDDDRGFTTVAFRDPALHARPIFQPVIGGAPHDIHVECGQVPGYVMAGVRNRGMRAIRMANPPARHTRPARAPPEDPSPAAAFTAKAQDAPRPGNAASAHWRRPVLATPPARDNRRMRTPRPARCPPASTRGRRLAPILDPGPI